MSDDDALILARARIGVVLRGKYTLERVLGVGGMASVYEATHRNRKRFAIKMLHPEISSRESLRTRFLREGYVANSVMHTGAVAVLDDDIAEDGSAVRRAQPRARDDGLRRQRRAGARQTRRIGAPLHLRRERQADRQHRPRHARQGNHDEVTPRAMPLTCSRRSASTRSSDRRWASARRCWRAPQRRSRRRRGLGRPSSC